MLFLFEYFCTNQNEKRTLFSERSNAIHYANSDDEEDGYDSPHIKRKGASVDEFLKGSELGKQVGIKYECFFLNALYL